MATSFLLYDDALLVGASSGTWTVSALTDHSEGNQDRQYWFGSNGISTQLLATSNPGVDPITLTPTYILPAWEASTSFSLGTSCIPTTPNGYRYVVTTAGTSSGTEPVWGTLLNGTTTDGTVEWTLVAAQSNVNEIKLALTEVGLDSATGGASLSLGSTILSGVSEAVTFWVRDTNAITTVSSSIGQPEYGLQIVATDEAPQ